MAQQKEQKTEPLEKQLWKAADKLRKNIDAAEYKHIVLGLIFLKYISDSFEQHHSKLSAGEGEYAGADPEDKDEYAAENVFFVPQDARWSYLQSNARQPEIGKMVDAAMDAIEVENASLKGVLPKVFARDNLDPASLGQLIDLVGNIALGDSEAERLKLSPLEFAFYTAVANNNSAKELMQQDKLRELAVVLLQKVRENASIDWTIKESVRAKLKVIVKRTLRQFGYPPDMEILATETVLKQAEMIATELAR
jgi:type I restriction enzyme M protein